MFGALTALENPPPAVQLDAAVFVGVVVMQHVGKRVTRPILFPYFPISLFLFPYFYFVSLVADGGITFMARNGPVFTLLSCGRRV